MEANNAAAMREALSDACYAMFNFLKTQTVGFEEMAKALDKAKSALAIPLRQCDVGTDKEQYARFNKYCNARHKSDNPNPCGRADRSSNPCAKCYSMWVLMPYEAEGALK